MVSFSFSRKERYLPIVGDETYAKHEKSSESSVSKNSNWLFWIALACLLLSNLFLLKKLYDRQIPNAVYSPASSAITYKNIVSISGIERESTSPYQGQPNEFNEELWSDLYNHGMTMLPESDARKMANQSVPLPGSPGYYIATLDVFHHLHCLNMIRKRIWMDEPPMYGLQGIVHMDHCIEQIRQSLMCSSDITPRPYQWNEEQQAILPVNEVLRTCRDFDAISEWARERKAPDFDFTAHVEDHTHQD